ncbi:class I SAM-dependent methyltransferase [Polynucleobacter paneuropaeus]|nr:class I SAM-dependent methyltransferase [Polynucleobacter paneuropaeus]
MTIQFQNQTLNPLIANLEIFKAYQQSPYLSLKHSAYFQVYEELLSQYRGKSITFVEVGVLNGGSLFMWRNFFGPQARIIGIDFNPLAKRWEQDGFEIYIGSQSSSDFWKNFFSAVGPVDVLLDDGGHTNEQQIVTTHEAIPFIKDGGLLPVEDVHTSYFKDFGNPSKYSFINYAKQFVDVVNSRFPGVQPAPQARFKKAVYSVHFYDSIVGLSVDRTKCFTSSWTSNEGQTFEAEDYRHHDSAARQLNQALIKTFHKVGLKVSMGKFLKLVEAPLVKNRLKRFFK